MKSDLVKRLQDFIESEARSCSMEPGCITPEYVYRMWGGINEDDLLSSSQMTSQQLTDARQIYSSRSGSRGLREVPSQVTAECCHQRWFHSNRQNARQIYSSCSGSRQLREGCAYTFEEIASALSELKKRKD